MRHSVHVEARGQLRGVRSLCPSCGHRGSNSGHQAWHLYPLSHFSFFPLPPYPTSSALVIVEVVGLRLVSCVCVALNSALGIIHTQNCVCGHKFRPRNHTQNCVCWNLPRCIQIPIWNGHLWGRTAHVSDNVLGHTHLRNIFLTLSLGFIVTYPNLFLWCLCKCIFATIEIQPQD